MFKVNRTEIIGSKVIIVKHSLIVLIIALNLIEVDFFFSFSLQRFKV